MAEDDDIPRDAKMVMTILESMGVTRCEPRVINQFLDLWYRYVVDVLGDAQTYSEHAGKPAIDCDDVKLAIQSRVNSSFQQPPPREVCPPTLSSPTYTRFSVEDFSHYFHKFHKLFEKICETGLQDYRV